MAGNNEQLIIWLMRWIEWAVSSPHQTRIYNNSNAMGEIGLSYAANFLSVHQWKDSCGQTKSTDIIITRIRLIAGFVDLGNLGAQKRTHHTYWLGKMDIATMIQAPNCTVLLCMHNINKRNTESAARALNCHSNIFWRWYTIWRQSSCTKH